jgi:hypothetical protein
LSGFIWRSGWGLVRRLENVSRIIFAVWQPSAIKLDPPRLPARIENMERHGAALAYRARK